MKQDWFSRLYEVEIKTIKAKIKKKLMRSFRMKNQKFQEIEKGTIEYIKHV